MGDVVEEVRVCGQCAESMHGEEWPCPGDPECGLALCGACSCPEVHFRDDGSCPPWWGESLTEEEIRQRMREAAEAALRP